MAIDSGRVKEYEALQIAKEWESLARNAGQQLAISMADPLPPGGDTGRHSPKPGQKPSSPYEKGKSPHTIQAGLRINPNTILLPKEPAPAESDDDYGEGNVAGHPDWKLSRANNIRGFQDKGYQLNIPLHDWKQIPPGIKNDPDFINLHLRRMQAHGGPFYNEYGQPISDPSKGHSNNGVPLPQIEHLKQTPKEMKENEERHKQNYPHPSHDLLISDIKNSIHRENDGGTLRDVLLPLLIKEYGKTDGKGGYKNPGALLSGMKKLV